ncbi:MULTISPECIES: ion transporter [Pseudoalteromonas]|uniref:Ion transporter n=1 Tax=Pseudoalteromonas distincta TaxID=77608 RepID=A0A4P9J3R5_9GAMM|nr:MULTISPECIES: ion transporter [Pseudoalteromonas]PLT24272.1 ion transporter [Pseudoalteromonas sp. MelDa3]QCU75591.1 ion transporter [Pseudoalteromonas distincta]
MVVKEDDKIFLDRPIFVWVISGLILFSVLCFSVETLPDLSSETKVFLKYSELLIAVIFTLEYLTRVALSQRRLNFVFSFYGVVDLVAILPFYLAFAVDLRTLRLIRLLRLVRVLKVVRYNTALLRFARAIYLAKEELVIFTGMSLVLLYLSAVGIYHFEHTAQPEVFKSIFDSLWWSVATLTTVGYGDIYPITIGGRFFTFFILMIGLGLVAVPTGIVASALSAVRREDEVSCNLEN